MVSASSKASSRPSASGSYSAGSRRADSATSDVLASRIAALAAPRAAPCATTAGANGNVSPMDSRVVTSSLVTVVGREDEKKVCLTMMLLSWTPSDGVGSGGGPHVLSRRTSPFSATSLKVCHTESNASRHEISTSSHMAPRGWPAGGRSVSPEPQLPLLEAPVATLGELVETVEVGWFEVIPEVLEVPLHDLGCQTQLLGLDRGDRGQLSQPRPTRLPEGGYQRCGRAAIVESSPYREGERQPRESVPGLPQVRDLQLRVDHAAPTDWPTTRPAIGRRQMSDGAFESRVPDEQGGIGPGKHRRQRPH